MSRVHDTTLVIQVGFRFRPTRSHPQRGGRFGMATWSSSPSHPFSSSLSSSTRGGHDTCIKTNGPSLSQSQKVVVVPRSWLPEPGFGFQLLLKFIYLFILFFFAKCLTDTEVEHQRESGWSSWWAGWKKGPHCVINYYTKLWELMFWYQSLPKLSSCNY